MKKKVVVFSRETERKDEEMQRLLRKKTFEFFFLPSTPRNASKNAHFNSLLKISFMPKKKLKFANTKNLLNVKFCAMVTFYSICQLPNRFFVCKNFWPVHLFSPEGAPASWTHICISDAYRAVLQAWSPPSRQSSQVKT